MKKLLLALPIIAVLSGCGSTSVEDVAHDYCTAIKKHDWRSAQDLATSDALRNRENMYDQNVHKYSNIFLSQNCDVSKTEQNSETEFSVFFGGSKLDSVEIEWDEEKEQFFVTSDAFKNDLKLY